MRVSTAALVAATATALAAMGAQADDVQVKVASFNVRTSQAPEDALQSCSNWAGARKGNVVGQFNSMDADFVGTQETSDDQRGYLDDTLKATYKSIGTRSGSLDGRASEVDAIYYKFADWTMLAEKTYWFGPNTDAASAAWNMQYYRTVVYGRFQHVKSGLTVCIANTHYETPGNDLAQNEASKIIIAKTPAFCQAGDKITVLTGDFNAKPNYQGIQTLYADNWNEKSSDPTFCGNMLSPTCQEKFDFTLYKLASGTDVCHLKSEVIRQEFSGCYPSDHAVLMSTFCISGSCCGTTPTPTPSPSPDSANQTNSSTGTETPAPVTFSTSGSGGENEAEVQPGVVSPAGGSQLLSGTSTDATGGGGDAASAGGSGTATQINTKSESTTSATGTVFAVMGVIGVVGAVCAFVIKKKRALESQLDDQKSGLAPIPSFFSRADADALSPQRATQGAAVAGRNTKAMARKFSSPVPTLETITENRDRSFSQTSSIPCDDRRSSVAHSDRYGSDQYGSRMSSPVLLDDDGRETGRGSSRLYFSEVVSDRVVSKKTNDFALL